MHVSRLRGDRGFVQKLAHARHMVIGRPSGQHADMWLKLKSQAPNIDLGLSRLPSRLLGLCLHVVCKSLWYCIHHIRSLSAEPDRVTLDVGFIFGPCRPRQPLADERRDS